MAKPVCLIIGAGDYIGATIAKRFAAGGYHVAMGRRRGEMFAPLIEEIEARSRRAAPDTDPSSSVARNTSIPHRVMRPVFGAMSVPYPAPVHARAMTARAQYRAVPSMCQNPPRAVNFVPNGASEWRAPIAPARAQE